MAYAKNLAIGLLSVGGLALDIPVTLLETAGAGALTKEPVTFVVPLPQSGRYQDPGAFRLEDGSGNEIPAQFDVLTRWLSDQNQIEHLLVNAQVDLASNGTLGVKVKDSPPSPVANALTVTDNGSNITVNTGPLQFTVKKNGFNIFDQVAVNGKTVIQSSAQNGGTMVLSDGSTKQYTTSNTLTSVSIEEAGPLRASLRIFGKTSYTNKAAFQHGFVCRIFAYAGKPYVRVDFTLRNTPHTDKNAGPFYFQDFSLEHVLNLGASVTTTVGLASGASNAASVSSASAAEKNPGWIDVFDGAVGVAAFVRHFWEVYPKKNEYLSAGKKLKIGLWPDGFNDYYYKSGALQTYDRYWLDDGMQKTFQVVYHFHDQALQASELSNRSAVIARYPVGHVSRAVWNQARTLLEGGYVDPDQPPAYNAYQARGAKYGYLDFNGQTDRLLTGGVGGWPNSGQWFVSAGKPQAYFDWESWTLMETDVRPTHMDSFMGTWADTLMTEFATNQYYGLTYKGDWDQQRWWESHADCGYEGGTGFHGYGAWDTQHMWVYPHYDMFLLSGDRRIKDFLAELGDFMTYHLAYKVPLWSRRWGGNGDGGRAAGHSIAAVVLAYKATQDPKYYTALKGRLDFAWPRADKRHGPDTPVPAANSGWAPFELGFYAKALINFLSVCKPADEALRQKALSLITAFNDASFQLCWAPGKGFAYRSDDISGASVSGITLTDAAAWLYLSTGFSRWYRDSLKIYTANFFNSGNGLSPYWTGDNVGRTVTYVDSVGLTDTVKPGPITDLSVSADSKLTFTSPGGRGFIVRWHGKKINDTHVNPLSLDTSAQISWWAAEVSPSWEIPLPKGSPQTIELYDVPAGTPVHVMLKTIGANGIWSLGSNDATATVTTPISSAGKGPSAAEVARRPAAGAGLTVFPNPVSGRAVILTPSHLPLKGEVMVGVYNPRGRKVASFQGPGMFVWNTQGLPSGIYVIRSDGAQKRVMVVH